MSLIQERLQNGLMTGLNKIYNMKNTIINILLFIQVRIFRILILREEEWICGNSLIYPSNTSRGKGDSALLNENGFKCCLGQFSLQLKPGVNLLPNECITGSPAHLESIIPYLSYRGQFLDKHSVYNTKLSSSAMRINDGNDLIKNKVKRLRKLFWKEAKLLIIYIRK